VTKLTPKIWLIADTHWGHHNIIEYESRPSNFNELMLTNWNSLVAPDDIVYHLGDIVFGRGKLILPQLNGKIILVRGNHDKRNSMMWFLTHGVTFMCDLFTLKAYGMRMVFTHKPIEDLTNWKGYINIFGHCHSNVPEWLTEQHKLFTIEKEGYSPVELRKFVERKY